MIANDMGIGQPRFCLKCKSWLKVAVWEENANGQVDISSLIQPCGQKVHKINTGLCFG